MSEQHTAENDARAREALADYLTRKVGPASLPIGTRVAVRSFSGALGTVVGPDGYPKGSALAVRMDRPYPKGFRDGYACVSVEECSIIPPVESRACGTCGYGPDLCDESGCPGTVIPSGDRHDRGCAAGVASSARCTCVTPPAVPRCTCTAGDDLPFPAQHATLCPRFAHPRVLPPGELVEPNTELARNSGRPIPPGEGEVSGRG